MPILTINGGQSDEVILSSKIVSCLRLSRGSSSRWLAQQGRIMWSCPALYREYSTIMLSFVEKLKSSFLRKGLAIVLF